MRAMVKNSCSVEIEVGKDSRFASLQRSVLEALRVNDRLQVEERRLEQGVDDNKVEMSGLRDLDAGVRQALLDHGRVVFAAPVQALREFFPAGRQDEDQDRVREQLLDLQR